MFLDWRDELNFIYRISELFSSLKLPLSLEKSLREREVSIVREDEDEDEDGDEFLSLVLIVKNLLFSITISFSLCLFFSTVKKIVKIFC
jgi:hypothetical protein